MDDQNTKPNHIIIPHKPVEKDEFDGAHQRIAKALEKIITNEEQPGISIGLEGPRGSGKSTVLKILQKNIREDIEHLDNTVFAIIDTWAHGGDQLRRASLEVIVDALADKDWINKRDWLPKFEIAERKDIPLGLGTSVAVIMTITSWLFFPDTLQPDLKQLMLDELPSMWLVVPTMFFLYLWVVQRFGIDSVQWVINAFKGNFKTKIEKPSHEAKESSWLFQKWYRAIVEEALDRPNRNLVIVFDNLDRLSNSQSKKAVQTLQVFLDDLVEQSTEDGWRNRVTFICCYARDKLGEKLEDIRIEQELVKTVFVTPVDEKTSINDHFEKVFNVQFRVPLLPPMSWIDYARKGFKRRGFDETVVDSFIKILQRFYRDKKPPTPRELQLCINEMIALKLQNTDVMESDESLLNYWLWTKDKTDILEELLEWHFPKYSDSNARNASLSIDEIMTFSAYYMGMPKRKAYQALISRPIRDALRNAKSPEILKKLSENAHEYTQVLTAEIEHLLEPYTPVNTILETIYLLYQHEDSPKEHEDCFNIFQQRLPLKELELLHDEDMVDQMVEAIDLIFERLEGSANLSDIIDPEIICVIGGEKPNRANSSSWFEFYYKLIKRFSTKRLGNELFVLTGNKIQCHNVLVRIFNDWNADNEFVRKFVNKIVYVPSEDEDPAGLPFFDYFRWVKGNSNEGVVERILNGHVQPDAIQRELEIEILNSRIKSSVVNQVCEKFYLKNASYSRKNSILAWQMNEKLREEVGTDLLSPWEIVLDRTRDPNNERQFELIVDEIYKLEQSITDLNITTILEDVSTKSPFSERYLKPVIEELSDIKQKMNAT